MVDFLTFHGVVLGRSVYISVVQECFNQGIDLLACHQMVAERSLGFPMGTRLVLMANHHLIPFSVSFYLLSCSFPLEGLSIGQVL